MKENFITSFDICNAHCVQTYFIFDPVVRFEEACRSNGKFEPNDAYDYYKWSRTFFDKKVLIKSIEENSCKTSKIVVDNTPSLVIVA